MLTLDIYKMGRDKIYPSEWTFEVQLNAQDLIKRLSNLFNALKIPVPAVTSGWRPLAINVKAGGAKRSLHMIGKACDFSDPKGSLKQTILDNSHFLLDYGIWMEDPKATPTWCHLDTGIRDSRLLRVFKP